MNSSSIEIASDLPLSEGMTITLITTLTGGVFTIIAYGVYALLKAPAIRSAIFSRCGRYYGWLIGAFQKEPKITGEIKV